MAFITLDFLNKNMLRKYPFRADSTHTFENGLILPVSLISSIQVSVPYALRNVYVNKIYAKSGFVSVLLRNVDTNVVLGSFSGAITQPHQRLVLDTVHPGVSGTLTIGDVGAIDELNGSGYLNTVNGRLEDSTVFCYTPPAVTSFVHNGKKITGDVTFVGNNVGITILDPEIQLTVLDTTLILSKNDFSGAIGNCPTPIIKKINSVEPDDLGNIDVYGIDPIFLNVNTGKLDFFTPTLGLNDFCPERNKLSPPDDFSDVYYSDIFTVTQPEWKTWPQFTQ